MTNNMANREAKRISKEEEREKLSFVVGMWPFRKRRQANVRIHFSNRKHQAACERKRKIHCETPLFLFLVFQLILVPLVWRRYKFRMKCAAPKSEGARKHGRVFLLSKFFIISIELKLGASRCKKFSLSVISPIEVTRERNNNWFWFFPWNIFTFRIRFLLRRRKMDSKEQGGGRKRWQKRMLWSAAPLHLRAGRSRLAASREQSVFISFPFWFIEKWVNKYRLRTGHKALGERWAAGNYSENW